MSLAPRNAAEYTAWVQAHAGGWPGQGPVIRVARSSLL